jgi:NAD+ synthase
LIGYFTKYGDGGVDFLPISHLYKTQVRALARHLAISPAITEKPSSPQLYPGHLATDEIPLDYDQLDQVLVGLIDYQLPPSAVSSILHIPEGAIQEIQCRYLQSTHKRECPPMLSITSM